jgi:hypothetical protein
MLQLSLPLILLPYHEGTTFLAFHLKAWKANDFGLPISTNRANTKTRHSCSSSESSLSWQLIEKNNELARLHRSIEIMQYSCGSQKNKKLSKY